jgi:hypothetical protein
VPEEPRNRRHVLFCDATNLGTKTGAELGGAIVTLVRNATETDRLAFCGLRYWCRGLSMTVRSAFMPSTAGRRKGRIIEIEVVDTGERFHG